MQKLIKYLDLWYINKKNNNKNYVNGKNKFNFST